MMLFFKKMDQVELLFLISPNIKNEIKCDCLHNTAYKTKHKFSSKYHHYVIHERNTGDGVPDRVPYHRSISVKKENMLSYGITEINFLRLFHF